MKTNFMKALAFVGMIAAFAACKKDQGGVTGGEIKLNPTTLTIEEGKTATITAEGIGDVVVDFKSSNDAVASVTSSKNVVTVKGVKAGVATITATYNGKTAEAKVVVTKEIISDFPELKGSSYITIFVDEATTATLADRTVLNLGLNGGSRQFYIWGHDWGGGKTGFGAGVGAGSNRYGVAGGMMALQVICDDDVMWAGAGFCYNIDGAGPDDIVALSNIQDVVEDYDEWYFAVTLRADKKTAVKFNIIGSNTKEDGESGTGSVIYEIPGTEEWDLYETKLSDISGLAFGDFDVNGPNFLTVEIDAEKAGVVEQGAEFAWGSMFIYKK